MVCTVIRSHFTMFTVFLLSLGCLAWFPLTEARRYCGTGGNGEYCNPDSYQESYCCGYYDELCCYYTNVAYVWWFWLILVMAIIFFSILIAVLCRRRRLRRRLGYVVVRGRNVAPGSVVTRNNAEIAAVAPPGTVYVPYYGAAPPYQAYQGPYGGESSYGHPPPYAPPTAPPPTQK